MAKKILVLVKDKLRPLRDLLRGLNPIRFTRFDKYFIKPIDKNYEIKSELKKQICIFISSRNNYVMLENEILLNFNLKGFTVINVDDGSHEEALNEGKKICKKNDIVFLENISNGLQYSLKTCLNYIKTNNLSHKYIWHITHDNYPVFNNFYDELYNILSKNINFGLLGFNCFDYRLCRDENCA